MASILKVDSIVNTAGSGAPGLTNGITVGGNTTADTGGGTSETISSVTLSEIYTGTFTITWGGSFAATSPAQTITYMKIGKVVTLYIPGYTAAASGSPTASISSTAIPTKLRSTQSYRMPLTNITDNGAVVNSIGWVQPDGTGFTIRKDSVGTAWTATNNIGFSGFSVTYVIV